MIVLKRRRAQQPIIQSRGKCIGIAETVSGTLDNSNQTFYTSNEYEPSSIGLSYNGQLLYSTEDFLETGPNEITLIYIKPHPDDVLRALYEYDECAGDATAVGIQPISFGVSSQQVTFPESFPDTNYIVNINMTNQIDSTPAQYPTIVSSKTTSGFTVQFSGDIDSDNYILEWSAMGL